MARPKTTQLLGEIHTVLRNGTKVVIVRGPHNGVAPPNVEVDLEGVVTDVRPRGKGVQYFIDFGRRNGTAWVGGRYVERISKRKAA